MRQFELIANSIPQLAWMAGGDGAIFWYNQRWFDYTGTRLEDMQGWGWQNVHDPAELPGVLEKWKNCLERGIAWEDTFSLRRHDGQMRKHLSRASPFYDACGQLLFWFGTNTDIEDQLVQQRELNQTREQLQLSLDAGDLGIFHCPMPLREIVWNAKCKEHFFLPPEAEVDFALFNSIIHPLDRERVDQAVQAAVRDGAPYDIQYRTVGPAGEIRWIRAKGRTYLDDKKQPTRFDGITMDVSDEVRQAEERNALLLAEQSARQEAERASRMKDEFLATLSHELRTPLSAVLGWAQILQTLTADQPELQDGLKTIERNALVQQKLVEDLLDVSRIVSGKLLLDLSSVDLTEMVTTVARSFETHALAKQIKIALEVEANQSWTIPGDFARLQQAVSNLLSNAVKFTPAGGQISVTVRPVEQFVEIRVADSGPGIPPELAPHLFERFRQGDSSTTRQHGGLGLGLALAKQLVELHGGVVQVSNQEGGPGAVFSILLPRRAEGPPEANGSFDTSLDQSHAPPDPDLVKGLRIVIVDDDDDLRSWLQRLLTNFEATVLPAACAAEALELVTREKPDLLISDIGMPGEDGYSLISKVRQLPPHLGGLTPAAALTAFARPQDCARILAAGYQAHLTKPVDPAQLIVVIGSLVARLGSAANESHRSGGMHL